MNCVHCGVEIKNESISDKYYKWAFSRKGKYLCKNCGHEANALFDLPIFLGLLFMSIFLLGSGLHSAFATTLNVVYVGLIMLFGVGSTAFSQIKKWFKQMDEFYEVKK